MSNRNELEFTEQQRVAVLAKAEAYIASRMSKFYSGDTLTQREMLTLSLLSRGLGAAEISAIVGCRACTTRSHLGNIYRKLGASSALQAVAFARRLGIAVG